MINSYSPEGMLIKSSKNRDYISSISGLERAMNEGRILEGTALLCDSSMRLHIDLYGIRGIIDKRDAVFCRKGEEIKDIALITRVGKPTCFKVVGFDRMGGEVVAILSRRAAQEECLRYYLSSLITGDIIPARVTHLESFGAFVDIGCGALIAKLESQVVDGRRMMVPTGEEFTLECDLVLIAAGFTGCERYVAEAFGVDMTPRGTVADVKYATSQPKIFSCGDMRRGQSLVVWALREGRDTASVVDEYLMGYTNL